MTDVLILGGGIAGLATAHRLQKLGHSTVLLEASNQLGGLGRTFEHNGHSIECFYHCTMPSDDALLELAKDIGVYNDYRWRETTMGMVSGYEHFDFNTPLDLLRFTPLPLLQRLRLGLGAVSMRALGRGVDLDGTSSREWLSKIYGRELWDKVWFPLFRSKFGESAGDVPARYVWQRAGREGNKALRGYPPGGYRTLANKIAQAIRNMGGQIHLNTPVEGLDYADDKVSVMAAGQEFVARRAVSTLPLPLLTKVASEQLAEQLDLPDLTYVGVVNALFLVKTPLTGHYWTPVMNDEVEFDGIVEMSTLVGQVDGNELAYVMRYTDRGSELFGESDEAIAERWTEQFCRVNGLQRENIEGTFVFRAPYVEPIWPLNYRVPRTQVGDAPVFLATTAQVYPNVTAWNSSTELANSVAKVVEASLWIG